MQFEWDENKREQVIKQRGIDIVYAARIFLGETLTKPDGRADYGEDRFISLGMVGDECFVVVHTKRNETIRLITAWKGGRDERSAYKEGIAFRHRTDE